MNLTRRVFISGIAAGTSGFLLRGQAPPPVLAETSLGRVRGIDANGIKTFKGIPYGASTSGSGRFMPPQDPVKWGGVRDALAYGPSAPQMPAPANESEDCLVLNVWTPAVRDNKKRPVMFWCHGGGFASGSGSGALTDGAALARRGDVVVVTINHRLNVFGFTYLEEFGGPRFAPSGDVGMLDVVHALKWVRRNIAEFGGDASNVTIFGQSGGGRKVATLLAMPTAKGLFHRAIIQSGATLRLVERNQGTVVARELLKQLGNPSMEQLQQLPIASIKSAYQATMQAMNVDQMTMGFSPTMDGKLVEQHPFAPDAAETSPNVPLMVGSTRTELSTDNAFATLPEDGLRERIVSTIGPKAAQVIERYRNANPGASVRDLALLILSDHRYSAPVMKIAERRAALNKGPVYLYYFRWESPIEGGRFKSPHTIEIPFAFQNLGASRFTANVANTQELADQVSDAWIQFARAGNPNTPRLAWPRFNAKDWPTMVFDSQSRAANDPIREHRLSLFDAIDFS